MKDQLKLGKKTGRIVAALDQAQVHMVSWIPRSNPVGNAPVAAEMLAARAGDATVAGEMVATRAGNATVAGEMVATRAGNATVAGEMVATRAGDAKIAAETAATRVRRARVAELALTTQADSQLAAVEAPGSRDSEDKPPSESVEKLVIVKTAAKMAEWKCVSGATRAQGPPKSSRLTT